MTEASEPQVQRHHITRTSDAEGVVARAAFPYVNLDEGVRLVETIRGKGGSSCELDQLAAWLGTTRSSSKFRGWVSAAKMFGLIESRSKQASLTELGAAVVDPQQREAAKVEAFLEVPLYRQLHDKFAGQLLPPDAGLEAEMRSLGVPDKSAARARQVFQRSASSAGFFAEGKDRLVRPGLSEANGSAAQTEQQGGQSSHTENTSKEQDQVGPTDQLLTGLWSQLPATKPFLPSERKQWLEMMRLALDWVYREEDEGQTTDPTTLSNPSEPAPSADSTDSPS